jgi:hypothetical protein
LTSSIGVAYQLVPYNQTIANPQSIKVLTNWGTGVGVKVPSEISYSSSKEHSQNWGFDIDKNAVKMTWIKLQLDQQKREQELEWILEALKGMKSGMETVKAGQGGIPDYPSRNPVDIVADFLKKVREKVVEELRATYGAIFNDLPKEIVVTIPAVRRYVLKVILR